VTGETPEESDVHVDIVGADRDAEFSAFVEHAGAHLGRTAWLLCGDVHRAEELVQQALIRTYMAWPRARETDPLAYSRRVLANLRIDSWRKHRREVLTSPDEMPDGFARSGADQHADRDMLVRALRELSPQRRRVVVLRYLMDLPEEDVARDLRISVGTVKSTASRGLAQLRTLMGDTDTSYREPIEPNMPTAGR